MTTAPLTERGRRTRDALVDAAMRVFQRDGLAAARLSDIAEECGVSAAAVYRYFESKEQILAEVVRIASDRVEVAVATPDDAERALPLHERFPRANRRYLTAYCENAQALRFMEQCVATDRRFLEARRELPARFNPRLARALAKAAAAGEVVIDDTPEMLSELLGAMVDRTAYIAFALRGATGIPPGLAETIDLIWENVLGLTPRTTEPVRAPAPRPIGVTVSTHEVASAKAAATRSQLLWHARALFERQGYLDTRVADIAKAAKVAHGTFYNYFDSRFDVFAILAVGVCAQLLAEMRAGQARIEAGGSRSDPQVVLERIASDNRITAEFYLANARFMGVFEQVAALEETGAEVRLMVREQFISRAARFLARLQSEGAADPRLDPWIASDVLVCMLERITLNWSVLGIERDLDAAIHSLSRLWVRAIGLVPARIDTKVTK